jgi:hypothetical protein
MLLEELNRALGVTRSGPGHNTVHKCLGNSEFGPESAMVREETAEDGCQTRIGVETSDVRHENPGRSVWCVRLEKCRGASVIARCFVVLAYRPSVPWSICRCCVVQGESVYPRSLMSVDTKPVVPVGVGDIGFRYSLLVACHGEVSSSSI